MRWQRSRFSLPALATAVAMAPSARAEQSAFFDKAFAKAAGGQPCYARNYDDKHLAEHPQQTVRAIEVHMERVNLSDIPNTPERFELSFALRVTTSEDWFVGAAICQASASHADCFIEGDGGRFQLSPAADGALRLVTGNYGIALESDSDFVQLSGTKGDDREFVLKPAPRSDCEAAAADVPRPQP